MDSPDVVRIADLDLFADCTKAQLRQIASLMTYLRVPRNRVLMREGGAAEEFVVIGRGTARVSRETEQGVAKVADVGRGEFLGEMALLTGSRRSATATATTDLAVFVSSLNEFRTIMQIAPSVADKVVEASIARSADLDEARLVAAA